MTTSNKAMTNAQALQMAFELAQEAGNEQLAAKLYKMHTVATKPRKKSDEPTKEQIARMGMVKECVALMQNVDEPISTQWVVDNVKYVNSPQKATAVLNDAIKQGLIVKTDSVKGRTRYILAN